MVELIDLPDSIENLDNGFFGFPPGVLGLLPLNPARWPAHAVATAFTDDVSLSSEPFLKCLENVEATLQYLASAQSHAQYIERFQQVCLDVTAITVAHEVCPTLETMVAGDYANKACAHSTDQMVEDILNPLPEDELSMITRVQKQIIEGGVDENGYPRVLRLRGGRGSKFNDAYVGGHRDVLAGTGICQENLPPEMRGNVPAELFTTPRRNNRPLWSYSPFKSPINFNGGYIAVHRTCFVA